jgi:hypothetical protein
LVTEMTVTAYQEGFQARRTRRGLTLLLGISLLMPSLILNAPSLSAKEKPLRPLRSVTGLVSDESENPISGATVTLTDLESGKKLASYTGDDGRYLFSSLEWTREYQVQATFKGITSRVRKVTTIDPRSNITLNLQIPPPKEEE